MDTRAVDLVDLFVREFELCKMRAGENVVVLAEPHSRSEYVEAAFGASRVIGARCAIVTVPGGSPVRLPSVRTGTGYGLASVEQNAPVKDLLKATDMVVDLTLEGFIHTPVVKEVLSSGTRMLFVSDPPEVLARNLPSEDDKTRVLAAMNKLSSASTMRVRSEAGTDLTADLRDSHPGFQCGFADDVGRWDHWPSTMVLCWPKTSNGTIVLQPGDVILPFKEYVRDNIALTIVDGRIDGVRGGADARQLERFIDDSDDENARYLSHMGWGMMPSADWFSLLLYSKESLMGMDARAYPGDFLFSTGPHPFMNRATPYHLDIPMRDCSIFLDGEPVVEGGILLE